MGLSTHVLDTSAGTPAVGVAVAVEVQDADKVWTSLGTSRTDAGGRVDDLLGSDLEDRVYRLTFDTDDVFPDGFYPEAIVTFRVVAPHEHHHIPLLLSPFGYTTYRGS